MFCKRQVEAGQGFFRICWICRIRHKWRFNFHFFFFFPLDLNRNPYPQLCVQDFWGWIFITGNDAWSTFTVSAWTGTGTYRYGYKVRSESGPLKKYPYFILQGQLSPVQYRRVQESCQCSLCGNILSGMSTVSKMICNGHVISAF
jgi:hypothetical protein